MSVADDIPPWMIKGVGVLLLSLLTTDTHVGGYVAPRWWDWRRCRIGVRSRGRPRSWRNHGLPPPPAGCVTPHRHPSDT